MKTSRYQKNNAYFAHILKISLISSLLILTTLFYLWPRFNSLDFHRSAKLKVDIFVSDIPVTRQPENRLKPPPLRPNAYIPVPGNEMELPKEISISGSGENTLLGEIPSGIPAEIPAKPILEIYPQVSGVTCKGIIRLLLLVNKSGRVTEVEMVENTTASQECLELARKAAKKSEWIPARANGKEVDSWVIKVFKFNTKE